MVWYGMVWYGMAWVPVKVTSAAAYQTLTESKVSRWYPWRLYSWGLAVLLKTVGGYWET